MQRKWVVSGWAAAAAVAAAAGVGAVALAQGGSLAGPEQPKSEEEVLSALGSTGDATPSASAGESSASAEADASPTATATPAGPSASASSADGQVLGGDGGTFQAVCEDGLVRLDWWAPAQGWSTGAVDPGPAAQASITFTAAGDDDDDDGLVYEVACSGGVPGAVLQSDDDDDTDD